jgi:DNA-binding MarR family transcriptional regulator
MEDELVYTCNQILCLILPKETHVNDIIEKTGLSKTKVFNANDFLEKAHFITKLPNKKNT